MVPRSSPLATVSRFGLMPHSRRAGVHVQREAWTNINSGQFLAGSGWHHVAYDFTIMRPVGSDLCTTARCSGSNTVSASISTLGANSFIGKHGDGQTTFDFNGLIDDVRVYDRTLDASEVGALADDLNLQDTDTVAIT